jgi:tartrate-resistant acid phosphatase type 5
MKNLAYVILMMLFSCKTSLEKGKNSFSFMVIGDWGWVTSTEQAKTANIMKSVADTIKIDYLVSTGDNFYYNGVQSIDDSKWTERYENMYNGSLLGKDWYVTLGNHDYEGNVQAQLDYNTKNSQWKLPKRYYTVEKTLQSFPRITLLMVFLDTSPFDKNLHTSGVHTDVTQQDTTLQKKWLDSTLANSKAQWKMVFGHHPLYTAGPRKGTMGNYIATFKPIFDKYKVDFYVAGHEHHLGHLKPDENHTEYVVSGGGGASITPISNYDVSKYTASTYGFTLFKVDNQKITFTFINNKGEKLYEYTKTK